MVIKTGDIN